MWRITFLVLFSALVHLPSMTHAQGVEYRRVDRPTIIVEGLRIEAYLSRMAEIAEITANGGFTSPQLSAFASEFSALKQEIDNISSVPLGAIGIVSNRFRQNEFSVAGLNLSSSSISIDSGTAGQIRNRQVLDEVNVAISELGVKAASHWQRVPISGSPFVDGCAGGFNTSDTATVQRVVNQTNKVLLSIFQDLRPVAAGEFGLSQRLKVNAELDYAKEEIEILGERPRPQLSARTQRFLNTVIDPVFLGINDKQVDAATVSEAQQQARQATSALGLAYNILIGCTL